MASTNSTMVEQDKIPLAQHRGVFDASSDIELQTVSRSPSDKQPAPEPKEEFSRKERQRQADNDDDDVSSGSQLWMLRPTNLTWGLITVGIISIPFAIFMTVRRTTTIHGVPASGLCALLMAAAGAFWIVSIFVDNFEIMRDTSRQVTNQGYREGYRERSQIDLIMFAHQPEQKITILTERRAAWKIFLTVVCTTIASATPLLCYSDHSACRVTPWIHDLRKALQATCIFAAVWFAKSLLLELMIIRARIRFHSARQRKLEKAQQFLGIAICGFCKKLGVNDEPLFTALDVDESDATIIRKMFFRSHFERTWYPFLRYIKETIKLHTEWRDDPLTIEDLEQIFFFELYVRLALTKDQLQGLAINTDDLQNMLTKDNLLNASKEEFWAFIDRDKSENITFDECLVMWHSEIVPYERELQKGTDGIRNAAKGVDIVASVVVLVAAVFIYAAFFSTNFSTWATPLWTSFTGIGFAIGGVATEFFNACQFVFAKQPYDVGDHVSLNGEKDLVVDDIHLTYTVMSRMEDDIKLQISHQDLGKSWIANYSRSQESRRTSREVIQTQSRLTDDECERLSKELTKFVQSVEEHSRHIWDVAISSAAVPESDGKSYIITMDIGLRNDRLVRQEKSFAVSRRAIWKELEQCLKKRENRISMA